MKSTILRLVLLAVVPMAALLRAKDDGENIILFQNHRISIAVPRGLIYSSGRDDDGTIMAKIIDAKETNQLQVSFRSDPASQLGTERQQIDFLAQVCQRYAEGSVERRYDFKPLEPHSGTGTYCTFTDASLVGTTPPKGEFLHVTTGVKVWPGWVIVFTLLSNDNASKEYQMLLAVLKDSFEEKPAPAAPTKS